MTSKEPADQYDNCPVCNYPCKLQTYPNNPNAVYATCENCNTRWVRTDDPTDPKKVTYQKWDKRRKIMVTIPSPVEVKFELESNPQLKPVTPKTDNPTNTTGKPPKRPNLFPRKWKIVIAIGLILIVAVPTVYYVNNTGFFSGIINQTPTPFISPDALSTENAARIKQTGTLNSDYAKHLLWSPDGKWLAVANYHIDIYNATSQKLVYTIDTVQWPDAIAFSPDSKMLVSSAANNQGEQGLLAWQTDGWGQVLTKYQIGDVKSMAFSQDGKVLATVIGKTVKLWAVSDWTELRTLQGGDVTVVAFSPTGDIIAAGGGTAGVDIVLWNAQTGEQLNTLKGHTNWIQSIVFSSDGKTLASGSVDKKIILWDINAQNQLRVITGHTEEITSVAFSPNDQLLASASWDTTVRVWNANTGDQLNSLSGHTNWVNSVAFSPDGATLASGANDNAVRLWGLP